MPASEPARDTPPSAVGAVDLPEQPVTRDGLLSIDPAEGTPNGLRWAVVIIAVVFGLWHVATNVYLTEPTRWQNAIHFAGFAFLAAVIYPAFQRTVKSRAALLIDVAYALIVAASALWIAAAETGLYERSLAETVLSWLSGPVD